MQPHASSETLLESWWISFVILFFLSECGMCGTMIRIHFDSTFAKFRIQGFLGAFPRAWWDSLAEIELSDRVPTISVEWLVNHLLIFQIPTENETKKQCRSIEDILEVTCGPPDTVLRPSFWLESFESSCPAGPACSLLVLLAPFIPGRCFWKYDRWCHRANDTGPATNFSLHRFWSVVYRRPRGGTYFFIWTRSKYASKRTSGCSVSVDEDINSYGFWWIQLPHLPPTCIFLCIGDLCSAFISACNLVNY